MHVIYISDSTFPSRTANSIQVLKMCQAFIQNDCQVTLFAPYTSTIRPTLTRDFWRQYGIANRIDIHFFRRFKIFRYYDFLLVSVFRAKSLFPDLVFTRTILVAFFSSLFRIPTILELHSPPSGLLAPFFFQCFLQLRTRRRLVTISSALKQHLCSSYSFYSSSLDLIVEHDGIDLERFKDNLLPTKARTALNLPDKYTIVYSGHLYKGRGIDMIASLAQFFPDIQFLIIGGNDRDIFQRRLEFDKLNLPNLTLIGFIPNSDLPAYLYCANILIMPHESAVIASSGAEISRYMSPLKMFEYLACGRPLIASDLPVLREVLNDTNSVLCDPSDITSWVTAINAIRQDSQLSELLSLNSLRTATNYSWSLRAGRCIVDLIR